MGLSARQRERYAGEGYLLLEDFVADEACDHLVARAGELVAEFQPGAHLTVFSTEPARRPSDAYFLESGDQVRFFFEDGAVDREGRLAVPMERAVNKIGHALHDRDPTFSAFSRTPKLAALADDLGFENPCLLQSMYIFKQPGIGGQVGCHQDATFLYTEPVTVVGFWFALEDATVENGCLRIAAGSHRSGLKSRYVRAGDGGLEMRLFDVAPWPSADLLPVETPKGSLVILHGLLAHSSGPNRSAHSRHAYSLHVIDGTARYPADNWLRRAADMPLRGF